MRTAIEYLTELANGVMTKMGSGKDRHYSISVSIGFWFRLKDDEADLSALRQSILDIDEKFPWKDTPLPMEKYSSIHHLGEAQVVKHNWSSDQKAVWFNFSPHRSLMRSQLYAYERYVTKIGEELNKLDIPLVVKVTSGYTVTKHCT